MHWRPLFPIPNWNLKLSHVLNKVPPEHWNVIFQKVPELCCCIQHKLYSCQSISDTLYSCINNQRVKVAFCSSFRIPNSQFIINVLPLLDEINLEWFSEVLLLCGNNENRIYAMYRLQNILLASCTIYILCLSHKHTRCGGDGNTFVIPQGRCDP